MKKAVFIGRFQPFHRGHYNTIEDLKDEYELVIVIGSSGESRTEDNPLTADEREEIVKNCFPDIEVFKIEDEEKNEEGNKKWIEKIEEKTGAEAVISQNNLVKEIVEKYSDMELIEHDMHQPNIYSGTSVRRRIKSNEEWRYLVPNCTEEVLEDYIDTIKESGIDYDFEPGWKRKNAYN